eukprot:1013632_1
MSATTQITPENHGTHTPSNINNQRAKPVIEHKDNNTVPKSHETLIHNTFNSLSSDEKYSETNLSDDRNERESKYSETNLSDDRNERESKYSETNL